jgi:hypothetical protein
MMRELTALWNSLGDAEYLHLLLEPLPLFGLGFGLLLLIAAFLMRDGKMRVLALIVVVVSSASVQPYQAMRTKSEPRILALQDPSFHAITLDQSSRRKSAAWLYYAIAAWGMIALVTSRKGAGLIVTSITFALCTAGFITAIWLHKKECEVFHRNIVKYTPVR